MSSIGTLFCFLLKQSLDSFMKVKRTQSILKMSLTAIAESDEQEKYASQLQAVKKSQNYKKLQSVVGERNGIKKVFFYHYSEGEAYKLGAGSYGQVFSCYFQQVMTRRVHKFAMKVIQVPSNTSQIKKIEDIVATTRQEIKSLLKLRQNPNIIKIEDVIGEIKNNRIYLILEFCNNKDLPSFFQKLRKEGRLKTEEDVLFYFKQLVKGFEDLYKYNIIHRDIKPDNILAHNNTLKIADFGLSQQLFSKNESLHDHRMIGTLLTSAPQLIFKKPYTNKCDIYSLGLTLYWMLFQKFPFSENLDHLDANQLLNQSISIDYDASIKVSPDIAQLIKHMVAYEESDRIDWQDLFKHPSLQGIRDADEVVRIRDSIGRNLPGQSLSLMLESNIPSQFYNYIGENSDFDLNVLLQGSENKEKTQCFMKVFMEGVNFKFKVNFMKMLLKQICELKHSEIIKNKAQFAIIKDLLRLGIDNYILFLNKAFKDELNGLNTLHILDFRVLNEINTSKYFYFYVERFSIEIEAYQNSCPSEKLRKAERQSLEKNCKAYSIMDNFHLLFKKELLLYEEKEFLEQVKKCIVELIYFIKQEVFLYADREKTLPDLSYNRYKQLIILIHHLNMFIIHDKIFPLKYDPEVNYDTQKFTQNQKFENRNHFFKLAKQVKEIIARFEN